MCWCGDLSESSHTDARLQLVVLIGLAGREGKEQLGAIQCITWQINNHSLGPQSPDATRIIFGATFPSNLLQPNCADLAPASVPLELQLKSDTHTSSILDGCDDLTMLHKGGMSLDAISHHAEAMTKILEGEACIGSAADSTQYYETTTSDRKSAHAANRDECTLLKLGAPLD